MARRYVYCGDGGQFQEEDCTGCRPLAFGNFGGFQYGPQQALACHSPGFIVA
jgi:hypothetical protein